MLKIKYFYPLLILFVSVSTFAGKYKDHPLLEGFPGYSISMAENFDFGKGAILSRKASGEFFLEEKGGAGARIEYMISRPETTSYAICKNAQNALERSGFKLQSFFKIDDVPKDMLKHFLKATQVQYGDLQIKLGNTYVLMTRQTSSGIQYVAVTATENASFITYLILEESQQTFVPLEVSSADVSTGLKENGKIELYGMYFDTGKAILKSESRPTLDKINQVLKADPTLKIYIVGHTDNSGNFANNMQLSQERAKAVMVALVKDYGIEAARLSAQGVASLSPLASNSSEFGKAKNRRVELVQQ